ncbi:MAG TPA: EAL domain-containing protein [Acidimicrobiales bacterium]|nr:EAL domain-containing protein [Acidimicrobiales bacterium]
MRGGAYQAGGRVVATGAAALVTAAVLFAGFLRGEPAVASAPLHLSALLLALGFAACETWALWAERTHGEPYGFTLAHVPLAVGLVHLAPGVLLAARVGGVVASLVVTRHRRWADAVYEVCVHVLQTAVAAVAYRLVLGDAGPSTLHGAVALAVAIFCSYVTAAVVLTALTAEQGGWPGATEVVAIFRTGGVAGTLNGLIGIGLVLTLWHVPNVLVVVSGIVLAGIACNVAYRGLLHRYQLLQTHYDFVASVVRSTELSEIAASVLEAARRLVRADDVLLLLRPAGPDEAARRLHLGRSGREAVEVAPLRHVADLQALMPSAEPQFVTVDGASPQWLRALGSCATLAAPLTSTEGAMVGALVVTQARPKAVTSFGVADATLLGTLAAQASIAIENGMLFHCLEREAAERAHQATHDPLTGLPNRDRLQDIVEAAIESAYAARRRLGMIVVNIDSFSQVADAFGHASADGLLVQACERLRGLLPESAALARLGNQQFAVVLPEVADAQGVVDSARLLIAGFDPPFQTEGVLLALSVSVGIAVYPEQAIDVASLVQRAHIAADTAARRGSGWEMYDPRDDPATPRRLALAADLRESLETGGLDVCYQPKVELSTGVIRGAEALVRWNHPRLGRVKPDEFIAVAEQTGDIRALTMVVMRNALAECRSWRDDGLDLGVAVNLSARNLLDLNLVDEVAAAIEQAGVPPVALTLEITESMVMSESPRSMNVLSGLNDLGVRLACDDFGTGYSSLAHVRRLPIGEIKIDKSFVASMVVEDSDRAIARSVLTLGRDLGLVTVAEGVESREGWDLLAQLGCDLAQGFVVCPPLTARQFGDWLARRSPGELCYLEDPGGASPAAGPGVPLTVVPSRATGGGGTTSEASVTSGMGPDEPAAGDTAIDVEVRAEDRSPTGQISGQG